MEERGSATVIEERGSATVMEERGSATVMEEREPATVTQDTSHKKFSSNLSSFHKQIDLSLSLTHTHTHTHTVQLWVRGNYHWYLKQEISSPLTPDSAPSAGLQTVKWDPVLPLRLHIISSGLVCVCVCTLFLSLSLSLSLSLCRWLLCLHGLEVVCEQKQLPHL